MTLRFARPFAALALLVALVGCDSAGSSPDADMSVSDDVAVSVAGALAMDGGGLVEDAAAGAAVASVEAMALNGGLASFPNRPGCTTTRTFDAAAVLYTLSTECARTSAGGRFSAAFSRVATARFFGADGQPQAGRAGAVALDYDIVSGSSAFLAPRRSHRLTSLSGDLSFTDLDDEIVTLDGTYERAATDTLETVRGGQRTLAYELALTFDDVRGPRGTRADWHLAVSGTITGTYHALRTLTTAGGTTTTREVDRTVTITLPDDGSGTATIAVDGERYTADLATGAVEGVE